MATGSIRIIRDETGGVANGSSGASRKTGGITITPDAPTNTPTVAVGSRSNSAPRKRRHSDVKRAALSIEDRDGTPNPKVGDVKPNKTTPSPVQAAVAKVYSRKGKARYYNEEDASKSARYLLSSIEVVCTATCGPTGEMTELERGVMTPALSRVLQRTPIVVLEKANPIIDAGILLLFSGMYFSRVSGGIKLPSRNHPSRGVQEDTKSPVAAPVERTVDSNRAGDVDGLAVPVPSVLTSTMNGAI